MTTFTALTQDNMTDWDVGGIGTGSVDSATPTEVVINVPGDDYARDFTFTGTGLSVDGDGRFTGGTITGLTVTHAVSDAVETIITDFSISAIQFQRLIDTNDSSGLQTALFSGNDTLTGSDENDILRGDPPQHQVRLFFVNEAGEMANGDVLPVQFSPDGTMLLVYSTADNLVAGDTN
jgi:hypothetical protein